MSPLPLTTIAGTRFSAAVASTMIFCDRPVTLSVSSRTFSPSTMSWNSTVPSISVRIAEVNGSHSTSSVSGLDLVALVDLEVRAVGQRVALLLAALLVDDEELAGAVDDHQLARLRLDRGDVEELHRARVRGGVLRLLGDTGRRAAEVEGPHGELGARLADRLGGDDADRLADLDRLAGGQVAAVAGRADAAPRLAGEHRADPNPLDARRLDGAGQLLGDLLADVDDLARRSWDRRRPPGRRGRRCGRAAARGSRRPP